MQGSVSHELEVRVPASVVWDVYGTLELSRAVVKLLPNLIEKIEVVEGDGGVGTILALTFPQGTPGFTFQKEKFVKVDDEKHVKEAEVVEGGYLLLGFTVYRVRFEIIERDSVTSIIRSTIEYEFEEGSNANQSMVSTKALEVIAKVVGKHLEENASAGNA